MEQQQLKTILDELFKLQVTVNNMDIPSTEKIVSLVIQTMRTEQRKASEKTLLTQNEANQRYGRNVITALRKRNILQPYRFDTKTYHDADGEEVTIAKGTIYYRMSDIEKAIEKGNVLITSCD